MAMAIPFSTLMRMIPNAELVMLVNVGVVAGLFSWFRRRREETSSSLNRSFDGGIVIEEPERIALRERHGVRPLTEEEEGTGIGQLPDGVYGFTNAVGQWDAPLFRKKIFLSYEMHKLHDGSPVLVGYVSSEDAERMRQPAATVTIRLFPDRQDEAPHLVSIPLERVRRHKQHSERTGRGLELELEPESDRTSQDEVHAREDSVSR